MVFGRAEGAKSSMWIMCSYVRLSVNLGLGGSLNSEDRDVQFVGLKWEVITIYWGIFLWSKVKGSAIMMRWYTLLYYLQHREVT